MQILKKKIFISCKKFNKFQKSKTIRLIIILMVAYIYCFKGTQKISKKARTKRGWNWILSNKNVVAWTQENRLHLEKKILCE